MGKKHKARVHKWVEGRLFIEELDFDSYDEAIIWYANSGIEIIKIYDYDGNLIFSSTSHIIDSYA